MQQTLKTGRATFGAGLMASVVLHLLIGGAFLINLPLPQATPQRQETVDVEMVREPETKPEPEKKPEEQKPEPDLKPEPEQKPEAKPEPETKPEPKTKPEEAAARKDDPKPAASAEPTERPVEKPAEASPIESQALESAAREGGKEAGGDRPDEPQKAPDAEPQAEPTPSTIAQTTPDKPAGQAEKPVEKPVETPETVKLPELDLPQKAAVAETLGEGEAAIETVPKPVAKPQEQPVDGSRAAPQDAVSLERSTEQTRAQRPPSELPAAKELFSADALSNPRVRQALGKLPPNRRIIQICNFETLEQIRRARPDAIPEGLVPFADGGGKISGSVLTATGGAYVSRGTWYDVTFQCTVDEKIEAVTAFRFAIGKAISPSERKARHLPDG